MCALQRSFFCGRGFTVYDNCSIQQTEKEKSFRFSVGGQLSELMLIDAESRLCLMCRSKGETVAHVVSECGNLVQTENIKEDTTTWRGLFTGNFVVNVDWKELIAGMNRSLREWWKVKTSRYCGISQSSVIGKLRQEDHTLSSGP
ncbi:uncharacterized protein [Montipora foliosa]|uniref:uncharacterized protein n=1 Tax=Montipora foliosa TaxID=591990 RepID=UPI0035F1454F